MNQNFENFCVVPFTRLQVSSNSTFKPCCRFEGEFQEDGKPLKHPHTTFEQAWQSRALKELRQEFTAGLRPKQCRQCWIDEAAGHRGLRKEISSKYNSDQIKNLIENQEHLTPVHLDIKLSNLCNLKCRICGPGASSTWAEEIRKNENNSLEIFHDGLINFENYHTIVDWLPHIERIEVFGGEPFMNPEFYKLLQLCVDHGYSSKITIHCNSNATVFATKFIRVFEHFKKISIYFSIDDIGERFTYQRNPANWNHVTANLAKFVATATPNVELGINCTVSLFNVYYLPEFVQWAESQPYLKVGFNLLHLPEIFSVVNLPPWVKAKIIARLENQNYKFEGNCSSWNSVINFLRMPGDSRFFAKALQEIFKIDRYRSQKFSQVFPELWTLISSVDIDAAEISTQPSVDSPAL